MGSFHGIQKRKRKRRRRRRKRKRRCWGGGEDVRGEAKGGGRRDTME
jgi:hypothetical protein